MAHSRGKLQTALSVQILFLLSKSGIPFVVSKGIPYPLRDFENQRSFLNIWNLSYIVERFILQSPESGIYHLADDEPVSSSILSSLLSSL